MLFILYHLFIGLDQYSRLFDVNGSGSCRQIKIQLWDTGGLERVASITNSYYKFSEAALLVFSLASLESFHSLSHHMLEILSMAENAKIFLIGNKLDLKQQREVSDDDIDLFMEQFPKFSGFFKVSAKTRDGIDEMWSDISEKLAVGSYKTNIGAFKLHNQYIGVDGVHFGGSGGGDDPNDQSNQANCCY